MPLLGFGSPGAFLIPLSKWPRGHFLPEELSETSHEAFYQRVSELTEAAVLKALQQGVRLLDSGTRHMNQQSVGRALSKALAQGVVERKELFICGRIYKCKEGKNVVADSRP